MAPALSPQLNRLDRILELVTDHEANYREQVLMVGAWSFLSIWLFVVTPLPLMQHSQLLRTPSDAVMHCTWQHTT
jgi:hypothetical protein